jgi:hypothetical protein
MEEVGITITIPACYGKRMAVMVSGVSILPARALSILLLKHPGQISGLALFPFHSNVGVALCFYTVPGWLFYEFDGSDLVYYGSADLGLGSFSGSRGLTYNGSSDTFYYSYIVYGTLRWIMEVGWMETSLEHDTWGTIKTAF